MRADYRQDVSEITQLLAEVRRKAELAGTMLAERGRQSTVSRSVKHVSAAEWLATQKREREAWEARVKAGECLPMRHYLKVVTPKGHTP